MIRLGERAYVRRSLSHVDTDNVCEARSTLRSADSGVEQKVQARIFRRDDVRAIRAEPPSDRAPSRRARADLDRVVPRAKRDAVLAEAVCCCASDNKATPRENENQIRGGCAARMRSAADRSDRAPPHDTPEATRRARGRRSAAEHDAGDDDRDQPPHHPHRRPNCNPPVRERLCGPYEAARRGAPSVLVNP